MVSSKKYSKWVNKRGSREDTESSQRDLNSVQQNIRNKFPKLDQASDARLPSKNSTSIGFDHKRKVDFSDVDELIGEEFLTAVATKKGPSRSPPKIRKQQTNS